MTFCQYCCKSKEHIFIFMKDRICLSCALEYQYYLNTNWISYDYQNAADRLLVDIKTYLQEHPEVALEI